MIWEYCRVRSKLSYTAAHRKSGIVRAERRGSKRRVMMRKIPAFCLWLSVNFIALPVHANEQEPPKHTRLSAILGALQWGENLNGVLSNVEKNLENQWKEKLKLLDAIGIDRLKKKAKAQFRKIKKSVVRFDGARTGFESSILSKEMLPHKNEALLKLGAGKQERYYFFFETIGCGKLSSFGMPPRRRPFQNS